MKTPKSKIRSPASAAKLPEANGDYVAVAIAYAEEAADEANKGKYGRWIRLAAQRFLNDLRRAQLKVNPPFYWSPEQANKACAFIELLPHVEGNWSSATIKLHPSQVWFVCNLFGFRNANGTRRFTTALFAVARKNAKSTLAAAILLYVYCTEPENGPQIISAATTGSQARIVWNVAKRMVEKTPALAEAFSLEPFANAIARYEVGGTFKPINAKASTQDGLNPSALSFDELHAHKTSDLFNVLRSAAGARDNPLYLYTTTEGHVTAGPWPDVRKFAFHVLNGVVVADHFLVAYYAVDDDDDDFDESMWPKANPLLGTSITLQKLREYAIEARHQPSQLAEFRTKRLNREAAGARGWIDLPRWRKCNGEVDLQKMRALPCVGAFDLASTSDMCSWRLVWWQSIDGFKHYYTWGRFWVPSSAVKQRNERGTIRYEPWVTAGLVKQTDGNVADYNVIQRDIETDCAQFNPRMIGYDPWNAQQMVNNLSELKLPLTQFRQGPASYHPAMKELEMAYTAERLHTGDDPVLLWQAANLVARKDVNSNMAPHKERSADKIDGMVALLMALGIAQVVPEAKDYQLMFV